ncbi:MAG: hypothetical protein BMS9Abin29_1250 [Gemmatimonadota bacterium]|nr:MAG: hypothetical protein BMS9Abin29_1250 [Gemmatimonadota bacterium]
MLRIRFPRLVSIFLPVLAVAGCGGGDSTTPVTPPPPPPPPAALTIVAGNDQAGEPGTALGDQLAVRVTDAAGQPLGTIAVAWSVESGGGSLASAQTSTDAQGQATNSWTLGPTAGAGSVSATVGALSVTFNANALLVDFAPTGDTQISGALTVATVSIPAGVTITVADDLTLDVEGAVDIAGALTGDCVTVSVDGAGPLTVTGTVSNVCSDMGATTTPPLTLRATEAIMVDSATIESSGDITISNVAAGAAPRAGSLSSSAGRRASARAPAPCAFLGASVGGRQAARGADGSPSGRSGEQGAIISMVCSGSMAFLASEIKAQGMLGGRGGDGTSSTPGTTALGGSGGEGGRLVINAGGDIDFSAFVLANPTTLGFPFGGDGGDAFHTGKNAIALGGDAGVAGQVFITASGEIRIKPDGLVLFAATLLGGGGGKATAKGDDGADADTGPAERGSDAFATGGRGSGLGDFNEIKLIGDVLVASSIQGAENIMVFAVAGPGGNADATGGNGGKGNKDFPDGARGGNAKAFGGEAGSMKFLDNLGGGMFLGDAGAGGSAFFSGSNGGKGFDKCTLGKVTPGGKGGPGGDLTGKGGLGGFRGPNREGPAGDVAISDAGNGGQGGDGDKPGTGGAAGSDVVIVLGSESRTGMSFQDGDDGKPCEFNFDVGITVKAGGDPNGHEEFIKLTTVTMIKAELLAGGGIEFTSGSTRWIKTTGTVGADGSFNTTGTGVAAGFSGVQVTFDGDIALDADGQITGITGMLVYDSANSVLPAQQPPPEGDGLRHPANYNLTGTLKPPA